MIRIGELDLRRPHRIGGPAGRFTVRGDEACLEGQDQGLKCINERQLARSDYAAFWTDGDRLILVGLCATSILLGDRLDGSWHRLGPLNRIDFDGRYDPGGFERVSLFEAAPTAVLVVYEVGAAVIDVVTKRLVWQRLHHDVQAHPIGTSDGYVWFETENDRFGFAVSDGSLQTG